MTVQDIIVASQVFFLLYFIGINSGYLLLNVAAFLTLPRHMRRQALHHALPSAHTSFEPPITLIVTAYNEEAVIVPSVRSLLQLDYSEFEIVIVNDGSTDHTLDVLQKEFQLVPFPEAFRVRVPHARVRAVYQSTIYPELRVIDKENGGGKADASNAGINGARFPLFCPLDADTILQRDSLSLMAQPFLEDRRTIAVGGTIRIANGCEVSSGFLTCVGLPKSFLALFQIIEYMRSFLLARVGFSAMNALPLISGAFGLFHKDSVIAVGGYRHDALGEDMELVMRLHRHFRLQGKPYRIKFVPDATCWTEAPESRRVLKNQRVRWQRGLMESVLMNRELLFHPRSGWLGWFAIPFVFFFEGLGGLVEVVGLLFMITSLALGLISGQAFVAFLLVALGLGLLLSTTALLLEEITFHTYPKTKHLLLLFAAIVLENFGYRQLNAVWRVIGLYKWMIKGQAKWGEMTRTASWNKEALKAAAPTGGASEKAEVS
ncbi:MAG: glycosyltransferase family 2 protein [Pyrinomonadaceae bacterium]|nr:glycosyltransferase family 2 protein [Pyrinomonadaceae bacterium]